MLKRIKDKAESHGLSLSTRQKSTRAQPLKYPFTTNLSYILAFSPARRIEGFLETSTFPNDLQRLVSALVLCLFHFLSRLPSFLPPWRHLVDLFWRTNCKNHDQGDKLLLLLLVYPSSSLGWRYGANSNPGSSHQPN